MCLESGRQYGVCHFAVGCLEQRELRSTGEKAGSSSLVGRDVSLLMSEAHTVRGRDSRQTQRVGRGACRHRKSADLGTEVGAEAIVQALCPGIIAIRRHETMVCIGESRENLWGSSPRVVTEKTQAEAPLLDAPAE